MTEFSRSFPIENLTDAVLKENGWFTDLLMRWRPAGDETRIGMSNAEEELARNRVGKKGECQHLRVAFRDGYMNFYCSGQSVANVKFVRNELRAKIHEKYLYGAGTTGERYVELTSRGFPAYGTGQLMGYEGMQEWISNASSKAGREKRFVDLIVGHNCDVIDLEMGLPAYSAEGRAPRIDLLALEHSEGQWQIVSWEVKLVGDGRARCSGEQLPKVVDQLKHYTEWLSDDDRAKSVTVAYRENCRLLVKLHEIARRIRPDIEELGPGIKAVGASDTALPLLDKRPRLLIAYDKDDESFTQKKHFDKLKLSGEHVKIVKRLSDLDLCQAQPHPL